jgi:hypothetical protein
LSLYLDLKQPPFSHGSENLAGLPKEGTLQFILPDPWGYPVIGSVIALFFFNLVLVLTLALNKIDAIALRHKELRSRTQAPELPAEDIVANAALLTTHAMKPAGSSQNVGVVRHQTLSDRLEELGFTSAELDRFMADPANRSIIDEFNLDAGAVDERKARTQSSGQAPAPTSEDNMQAKSAPASSVVTEDDDICVCSCNEQVPRSQWRSHIWKHKADGKGVHKIKEVLHGTRANEVPAS